MYLVQIVVYTHHANTHPVLHTFLKYFPSLSLQSLLPGLRMTGVIPLLFLHRDTFTSLFTVYTSQYGLITFVFTHIERKRIPTAFTLKLNNKRKVTNGCQNSHVVTTLWTAYTSFSFSPTTASRQPTWSSLVPGAGAVEKQDTTLLNILLSYWLFGFGLFYF
jgi:hypothetical protein